MSCSGHHYFTFASGPDKRSSINGIVDYLNDHIDDHEYDGFIGRGLSGIHLASLMSFVTGKKMVIVRKKNEKNHSLGVHKIIENAKPGDRLIFVDDLVATGATIQECIRACFHQRATIISVLTKMNGGDACYRTIHELEKSHEIPMKFIPGRRINSLGSFDFYSQEIKDRLARYK